MTPKSNTVKPRWRRWLSRAAWIVILLFVAGMVWPYFAIEWTAQGRLFDSPGDVPSGPVALLIAGENSNRKWEEMDFEFQADAAAKLWIERKVNVLIVSGPNITMGHNVPAAMKSSLLMRRVPPGKIVCDYAGLCVLDSVVRSREVFGAKKIIIIGRRSQNIQAVYLARSIGMDAIGLNVHEAESGGLTTRVVREIGARTRIWLNINIFGARPRFLGQPVNLPE